MSVVANADMNGTSMEFSRILMEGLPYPLLVVGEDNAILFANDACEAFFGSSINLLTKNKLDRFVPYGSPILELLNLVRSRHAAIREYKIDLSTPRSPADAVVDIYVAPVAGMDGCLQVMLQPRTMADQIDRQLTHRNAARSVTGLASMLAHEIKNPLSGIRGAAQLLESGLEDDEDRNLTQLIRDETDRIVKLVDSMEVFSDERPPQHDPVNIHIILEHVLKLARNGFGKEVEFVEVYDPSIPPVFGNRDQLVQVLINLVKNACEAMQGSDDRRLKIKTSYRPGIKLTIPGNTEPIALPLELSLRDYGCGIPEYLINNVFDPFVTTKTNGSGLGLALVSKIINDHGGVIEMEAKNPGTKVRLLLPEWKASTTEIGETK